MFVRCEHFNHNIVEAVILAAISLVPLPLLVFQHTSLKTPLMNVSNVKLDSMPTQVSTIQSPVPHPITCTLYKMMVHAHVKATSTVGKFRAVSVGLNV